MGLSYMICSFRFVEIAQPLANPNLIPPSGGYAVSEPGMG